MPIFTYKAKDRGGQILKGTLEADTRAAVVARLQTMGYFPVEIQGAGAAPPSGMTGKFAALAKPGKKASAPAGTPTKIKARSLTMFYRQMSDLVGAGVPLVKALGIVRGQSPDPALATLLAQVDRDVQAGDTFAKALERHPKIFTKLSTAMIHAGEAGGLLDEVLVRIADFAENEEELRSKIKGALAYPVIMGIAGTLVVGVLLAFVIPKIVGVFSELNQALPSITVFLIAVSGFLGRYWYVILAAIAAAFLAVKRYGATKAGRYQLDRAYLLLPVMGDVVLKREVARFTRTLGSLLRNGVPILNALDIAGEVLTNVVIQRELVKVPEGIAEGKGISGTLRGSAFFPPVVINMIAIGEETGNLPGVMLKVAGTYERQVERDVKTLTSIIEPIIILAMGLVVGFIVIAMLLPIFSLDPSAGG